MQRRRLGGSGPEVSAIGLGCMGMSWAYGPADPVESVATIQAALEAGIDLLDTGDFYGSGRNEALIATAIRGRRDQAVLSVKFGALRDPDGAMIGFDARPAAVKNFLAYTLQRLGTDHVDIYRPARVDPAVPIEDTVGAIADLVRAGHVRHLGLSEAGADTIRRAHAVHPVADVQIEYSLVTRSLEAEILPVCRELGVGVTAYGVLSRGLLSGRLTETTELAVDDFRARSPRFQGENLKRNLRLVEALRALATERGVTPAQLALAWALHRGQDIVPLVGARRRERLAEAVGALEISLDVGDMARLEAAVPATAVAGTRYDAHGMRMLDSEGRPGA
jgi:pyridoxine 4-dehydrogenase